MSKIRVLVVDDAVVIRRMLTDVLTSVPDMEVVGTAANGRIGLAKIPQLNPDLVTLDVEMPEMDGLETLAAIRKDYPHLPVILFCNPTQRGVAATLDALALGASDYVTKPANVGGVPEAMQRIREDLVPKIRQICGRRTVLPPAPRPAPNPAASSTRITPPAPSPAASSSRLPRPAFAPPPRIDVVAIGVSTGGPSALADLIPRFDAKFPVPIVIVQHMPPLFTRLLAERLAAKSSVPVTEAAAGDVLVPGRALLAPGGSHMALTRQGGRVSVALNQDPPENSCRPAVDVLFRSVTEHYGAGVLGVILTGMGQDGFRGCESIKQAGGQVIVQDEATSVVWGMPSFVARAGLADRILPLADIGAEVVRRVSRGRPASPLVPAGPA